MCLILSKNWEEETKKLKSSKKPIKVYKVLQHGYSPNTFRSMNYVFTEWKIGKLHKSNRKSTKLTKEEIKNGNVYKGFHFYSNKSVALDMAKDFITDCVCECLINPKDIVAVGFGILGYNSIVSTKAQLIKRIRKYRRIS